MFGLINECLSRNIHIYIGLEQQHAMALIHSSISAGLSRHPASRAPRATAGCPPPFRSEKRSYVGFKMRCAARVATRCVDGQLDGWMEMRRAWC